jgi:hypothetical protein
LSHAAQSSFAFPSTHYNEFVKWVPFLIAAVLQAQPVKPDTRALTVALKTAHSQDRGSAQYRGIRQSFLAWVDTRLKSPDQIDALKRELRGARLAGPGREEFWGTDNTGLLDVAVHPLPNAPDLFAVRLGIGVPI